MRLTNVSKMSIHKIISGGQTGADRAGLDVALKHGIQTGGFCPKGRRAEDGAIPEEYPLVETESPEYAPRTAMNVRTADGTLILNIGNLDGGTRVTAGYSTKLNKPFLVVQLGQKNNNASQVADWLADNCIRTLNIAGPRESKRPGIYSHSLQFLEHLIRVISRRTAKKTEKRATEFLQTFFPQHLNNRVFLAGGIVRDILIGQKSNDLDLVAAVPETELKHLGFRPVAGKTTRPIMFCHDPAFGTIEVTLIPSVECLVDDLTARDFTCNAMAMAHDGELIDPLGGKNDLNKRKLKACHDNSFQIDPIRIFRGFRFEADGWQISENTAKQIKSSDWDERLAVLPVERFSREMQKAFSGSRPATFFKRMLEFSLGRAFLPELFRMQQIPAGPIQHHPEGDLFSHSCQVLERVSAMTSDPLARFCAFFHDLGKLATNPEYYPKHHGHDKAGYTMAEPFCNRLKLPNDWMKALAWVNRLHGNANCWGELRSSTKIRMAGQALKSGITEILPLVSAADKPGNRRGEGWDHAVRIAGLSSAELGIPPLQLQMMKPADRTPFILQKRIESFEKKKPKKPPAG